MPNRYNLIDEAWIPVADAGRVSLRDIFSQPQHRALGGNPVQKIALMKLLLAIAQAAYTPKDEADWQQLGAAGLAQHCLAYLEQWHDRFYLYGERPFLQMPDVEKVITERTGKRLLAAKTAGNKAEVIKSGQPKKFGAGFYPDLPSENNTELSQNLLARDLSNSEKALFLISVMNFAFGGKRVESSLTSLAGDVLGNRYTAPAGPSIGGWDGQLHCFPLVDSIWNSLWVNLFTHENIEKSKIWPSGLGTPIWEKMPGTEKDERAIEYKSSYQATLLALSRFVVIKDGGILYLDGIQYPKVTEGWGESSLLIDRSSNKVKYVNPERKPWRELDSILSFNLFSAQSGFECMALKIGVDRVLKIEKSFRIWSGGLKVSSNSGDQSVKQNDDFVESQVQLESAWVMGEEHGTWFTNLQVEMQALEANAKILYGCVMAYFKQQLVDGKALAAQATNTYWQLCEREFQNLIDHCDSGAENRAQRYKLRQRFASFVHQSYDQLCPNATARQMDAWANCRPNLSKYLAKPEETTHE